MRVMKLSLLLATIVAGTASLVIATATPREPVAAAATIAAPAAGAGTTVTVRRSRFGRVLFDGRNRVLYLFTRETSKTPRCYGDCAKAWPPVLTSGRPKAGSGARSSLLGTTRRSDGKLQVTYRGRPLYYYVHDGPGQILCHDVFEFGGRWLVVTPSGRAAD